MTFKMALVLNLEIHPCYTVSDFLLLFLSVRFVVPPYHDKMQILFSINNIICGSDLVNWWWGYWRLDMQSFCDLNHLIGAGGYCDLFFQNTLILVNLNWVIICHPFCANVPTILGKALKFRIFPLFHRKNGGRRVVVEKTWRIPKPLRKLLKPNLRFSCRLSWPLST